MIEDLPDEDKSALEEICKSRLSEFIQEPYDDDFINWVYWKGYFAGLIWANYECWREKRGMRKLDNDQMNNLRMDIQSRVSKFFDDKMSKKNMKRQLEWRERHKDPKF